MMVARKEGPWKGKRERNWAGSVVVSCDGRDRCENIPKIRTIQLISVTQIFLA